jgi:exonuclease III
MYTEEHLKIVEEAGKGFGATYKFKYYPTRIDYILRMKNDSQNVWKFSEFENSDHYPIMTQLSLE